MCGIAGVLSREPLVDSAALAARLAACLAHRGPDDEGVWRSDDGRALLVHRRLSIIDPSPAGHQPMASPDGRHWLAFNGEVYNFRALRAELESAGERFITEADTEVLLRLLVRGGPAALASVRGMFAVALWDTRDRSLLLARDRFGIKPLYVAASASRVAFASEVRALVGSGAVERRIDAAGVLAFLRWGSVPPPLSWVTGVAALEPGAWRRWSADGTEHGGQFADARTLWTSGGPPAGDGEMLERTRAALVGSVAAHLVADVPVGLFLSGGIDSAALASAAHAAGRRLHTYTVVVGEAGYSEAREAQEVAARFDTVHHTLEVDASTVALDWPAILAHLDQPTGDAVNTYYASKAVASTGVKAVLSGVGGDEVFGGYPSFRRLPKALRLARALGPFVPAAARVAGLGAPASRAARWRQFAASRGQAAEAYRALRGLVMPAELGALCGPALADQPDAAARVRAIECEWLAPAGPETDEATVARLETTGYLRSQLLRDVDVMSMAHGLEVRVPFVDAPLIGAVWPAVGAHTQWLRGKRLLVEAAPHPLPTSVTAAPKRGFTLPFEQWMRGPLAEPITAGLAALARDGWISGPASRQVWDDWQGGRAHWSRAWSLGVLGQFLRHG